MHTQWFGALFLAGILGVGGAQAAPNAPGVPSATPVGASSPSPATDVPAPPLGVEDLDAISAGSSPVAIALTNQNLNAVNSGNSVIAQTVNTGQVSFANGAFQGFTGIGNFVINTGNNNNLQGSLSVIVVPLQ